MKRDLFILRKGFDIRLAGVPVREVADATSPGTSALCLSGFPELKLRLLVKEGDWIKRGAPLLEDKRIAGLRFCAPAGGRIRAVVYGPRRSIERMEIDGDDSGATETLPHWKSEEIRKVPRTDLLASLLGSGALCLIRRRPFSRIADPAVVPKSIFVNAMNTAPFRVDAQVAVSGEEKAFRAGLEALTRLTDGCVHVCVSPEQAAQFEPLIPSDRVRLHAFRGRHPAGNTSVHIHHLDPIRPGDTVWTISAADLVLVGRLLLDGVLPATRIVSLGGPGVRVEHRRHYRVRLGASLQALLKDRLCSGENRVVEKDVLSGTLLAADGYLAWGVSSLTVLPEGRQSVFLGWMLPGLFQFSHSRLLLSTWFRPFTRWNHTTNMHGGLRAMVATGLYDQFLPMHILTDFLVRAVLAKDTEEAVQLGLLETDPEDFALAAFACPSKMDLVEIIRKGLEDVEAEGL